MSKKFSWFSFIRKVLDLISLLLGRKSEKDEEEYNKVNENLNDQYDKIDADKEDNKEDDTEDRLNNMFD